MSTISLGRTIKAGAVSISSVALIIAVIAVFVAFVAAMLDADIATYAAGTVALAAIYTIDKKGGTK